MIGIMYLLKILAFVATITATNNYHGTNQKRDTREMIFNQSEGCRDFFSAIIAARISSEYTIFYE
jgi:hypothetical protein